MNKNTTYFGIDVSKDTFDVWSNESGHLTFSNDARGFKKFIKLIPIEGWCVMEYTGSYYHQLAFFLYDNDVVVSVINSVVIKRFIQMKLQRNKTDKSDAKMIATYAEEQELKAWKPNPKYIEDCKMIQTTMAMYFKQSTALKNKQHSFESKGYKGIIINSLKKQIKHIQKEIELLENEIEKLIKEHNPELISNISSIPGVGKKTALMLIACSNAFEGFENCNQLSAYFGLAPVEYSSGSSIRGRSRISKRGNPMVRNYLFMCSFTACSCNKQCKAIYERITNKGKSKKLALIAVCNKLLKQIFAIANSGMPYDPNYKSRLEIH